VTQARGEVRIEPKDGARARLFVAPAGAWITLEAGKIDSAIYTPTTGHITLTLDPASAATPAARLFVETTTPGGRKLTPSTGTFERGGYTIALGGKPTTLTLTPTPR
jgi:hypothetical protein